MTLTPRLRSKVKAGFGDGVPSTAALVSFEFMLEYT